MTCSAYMIELMKTPSTDGTNEDKTKYWRN